MAFKMKNPSVAKMVKAASNNRVATKNEEEYKVPSPEEQIRLAKIASEKSGKDLTYDARLSKIDKAHRFS